MIFLSIWIWSFVIVVVATLNWCRKNPQKMYLDVFCLMCIVLAVPGVATWTLLNSIYNWFKHCRDSKEVKEAMQQKAIQTIEDAHNKIQMIRGKF